MNTETVKTLAVALATIAVQVCAVYGIAVDYNALITVVSAIVGLGVSAWAIWHNYNFTEAAQEGQKVTDAIKAEAKGE